MAEDAKVICNANGLSVSLPLTQPTGKIRVKERSLFSEYGNPVRHSRITRAKASSLTN